MTASTQEASVTARGWSFSSLAIGLWIGLVFAYLYVHIISQPNLARRTAFLDSILQAKEKSDYLYATYSVARVHWLLSESTGLSDSRIFALIDGVGIVFMFLCAAYFLAACARQASSQCAGFVWLAVTSPLLLFQHHFYHPSDFYATGLMFHVLLAARGGNYVRLALLCLLSGLLWEKTLFVPFIYLLWEASRVGAGKAVLRACPAIGTTLLCFAMWRVVFPDAPRVYAHETWPEFAHSLGPAAVEWLVWVGPLLFVLGDLVRWRRPIDRFWLCWLLYLPLLVGVIVVFWGYLRELRSFWILQPIFAGLIVSWMDSRSVDAGKLP